MTACEDGGSITRAMSITCMHVDGDLVATERAYGPNHRQRRHEHERASVYLFVEGSCTERYGRRECEYRESSVVINPAGVSHAVRYGRGGGRIVSVEIGA